MSGLIEVLSIILIITGICAWLGLGAWALRQWLDERIEKHVKPVQRQVDWFAEKRLEDRENMWSALREKQDKPKPKK